MKFMAALFRWSAEHEVFLPEIDAEHRALFLGGRELTRAIAGGAHPDRVEEGVRNVLLLAEAHFLHEEHLMEDSDFESLEWHRTQHDAVRKRALETDPRDPESVSALLTFTSGWLNDHTAVADRIMASHLRNWGRRKAA
jgi:hemerythrin-like metal-binding protein